MAEQNLLKSLTPVPPSGAFVGVKFHNLTHTKVQGNNEYFYKKKTKGNILLLTALRSLIDAIRTIRNSITELSQLDTLVGPITAKLVWRTLELVIWT